MGKLPSFARMTMWFTPSSDSLLQPLLEAAEDRAAEDMGTSARADVSLARKREWTRPA